MKTPDLWSKERMAKELVQAREYAQQYLQQIKRADIVVSIDPNEAYEHADDALSDVQFPSKQERSQYAGAWEESGGLVLDRWCIIAPGWGVTHTLIDSTPVPWWYVFTYRTIHNTWEPDDVATQPLGDARPLHEALKLAITEVLRNEMDKVDERTYAQEVMGDDIPQ